MKVYSLLLCLLMSAASPLAAQNFDLSDIYGKWKLKSFDAIDLIKSSPAYLDLPLDEREKADDLFDMQLSGTFYTFFENGELKYTSFEGKQLFNRNATFTIDEDLLNIKEVDRPFSRQAKILELTDRKLVFSPVVDGKAGKGKMVFEKITDQE